MASETGDQAAFGHVNVMHEIDSDGIYRITVSDRRTGELQFTWTMPAEDGLAIGKVMITTISDWLVERNERNGRGHSVEEGPPETGPLRPDAA